MNAVTQSTASKEVAIAHELEILRPEISKVLPAHVSADKFMRVVATAIAQSPDLRNAERRSLLTACVKCATDGLVPDGREAALVKFNVNEKSRDEQGREQWRKVPKVQYMPMVAGILKKVRNSGELLSIVANVVHANDEFNYWVDDAGEHVLHKPNMTGERGGFLAVYAIAKTKDGGVYVEVMSRGQVEEVRAVSRAKDDGPWTSWYGEMARKTVIRRLSKRLPMSTDLEAVIRRDDELYDLNQTRRATATSGRDGAKAVLGLPILPDADDAAAAAEQPPAPDTTEPAGEYVDQETGEVVTAPEPEPARTDDVSAGVACTAIANATSKKQLQDAWKQIKSVYKASKRDVPADVETFYNDKLAELRE